MATVTDATMAVIAAAQKMPRETPAPGGACTVHSFEIEAGVVWALDRALRDYEAALAASSPAPSWRPIETQATLDVLAERQRQVEAEGWTPEHDDAHRRGELANAAACYALTNPQIDGGYWTFGGRDPENSRWIAPKPLQWPWHADWWKPSTDRRRNLVKSAALTLAEIERLDRLPAAPEPPATPEPEGR